MLRSQYVVACCAWLFPDRLPTSVSCAADHALCDLSAHRAPEQTDAEFGERGSHTDVWGFATTVLHLATGQLPYHGLTQMQILGAMARQRPPAVPDTLPAWLQRILTQCLTFDIAARPSVQQLLQARSCLYMHTDGPYDSSLAVKMGWSSALLVFQQASFQQLQLAHHGQHSWNAVASSSCCSDSLDLAQCGHASYTSQLQVNKSCRKHGVSYVLTARRVVNALVACCAADISGASTAAKWDCESS